MNISRTMASLAALGTQPSDYFLPIAPASQPGVEPTFADLAAQFRFPVLCAVAPQECKLFPPRLALGILLQLTADCTIAACVIGATVGLLAINRSELAKQILGANLLPVMTLITVSGIVTSTALGVVGCHALGLPQSLL